VKQLARKNAASTNSTCFAPVRPIEMAHWFANLVTVVSTMAAPIATSQKGSVSLSRSGLPLRSHAHRLTT
jgi:hypothetical protein